VLAPPNLSTSSEHSTIVQPRRRFAVVYNARAGRALPRLLDGVFGRLRADGCEIFQLAARSAEEATERVSEEAAANTCDAVLAAGGDGTFRAVASGAAGTALPVGVIPLGTGNVIAAELDMPRLAAPLAEVLQFGPAIAVQGGLANGAPFFLMAGAGFDGQIISNLSYPAKRAFGRAAFIRPTFDALVAGPQPFDVVVDGKAMAASWVIVTLVSRYGGSFVLTREASLGSPQMIAVVIDAKSRWELLVAAQALATGGLANTLRRPNFVRVMTAQSVEIGTRENAPIEIDGDQAGRTPLSLRRDGSSVNVIAPRPYLRGRVADLTNRHANHLL
jgi:diacylglycerol kinase (ATP)